MNESCKFLQIVCYSEIEMHLLLSMYGLFPTIIFEIVINSFKLLAVFTL